MNRVIIYRHQLFKPSEPFIIEQTQYLTGFDPIFVGRSANPTNSQKTILTLQSQGTRASLTHTLFANQDYFHQQLATLDPKLIHAHFGVEGVYAMGLAKKLNIPLITTFHGFDATCSFRTLMTSRKVSWLRYALKRRKLAETGNLFICVSEFIRSKLIQLGFPEQKLKVHYIGVDTDRINPGSKPREPQTILHVARLVEKKGTYYLLHALAILKQAYQLTPTLIIIGHGPLYSNLLKLSYSLGIQDQVKFLGMQPKSSVLQWMQQAQIFCLPSIEARNGDSEGLGMVFLEASATALPIVATQHGGITEVVQDDVNGYLIPEKNATELADRLAWLLNNESQCKRLGQAGRSQAVNLFNLKRQTQKLEDIYQNIR